MKKKKIFVALMIGLLGVSSAIIVCSKTTKSIQTISSAETPKCAHHHGYHYAAKEPTIDQPGHLEFWACCECHHQYLEQPTGDFIDRDDIEMSGGLNEDHIAYLPPVAEGGGDGDYWTNDPFDD